MIVGLGQRHRSKVGLRLSVVALVLALLAAACAGGDGESGDGGGGAGTNTGGGGSDSTQAASQPVRGGTLTYGLEAESAQGFTFANATCAISCLEVAAAIFDPLFSADESGKVVPYLAESATPNADHTQWTIKLRPNIKFHDGTPLDSAALKLNLDALKKGSVTALAFLPQQSVDVVDPLTVRVNMSSPWVAYPSVFLGQGGYIQAPTQLNNPQGGNRPIGTGPFVFKEWVVDDHLTATRNNDWWRGPELPYLDEVRFRPIPEVTVRRAALESGDINVMHTSNGDEIAKLRNNDAIRLEESEAFAETLYIMFNMSAPPLDDVRVRRAVALATDREEWNKLRYASVTEVANGPFPEGSLGYLADPGFPQFNLDEAKRLVAEYEAEKGPIQFTLGTSADPFNFASIQLLQQQWAKAGIEVNLSQTEQQKFIVDALQGKFQANYWRNHAGVDPDQQYYWWSSALAPPPPAIGINFGRIKDPVIDQALGTIRTNPDGAARKAAAEEINRQFGKEVYNLWLTRTLWAIAHRPDVRDVVGAAELPGGGKVLPLGGGRHLLTNAYIAR